MGFARGLLSAGAHVIMHGRDPETALKASDVLAAETGGHTSVCCFDITDRTAVESAIAQVEADVGHIDILVNNAGIQRRGPIGEFSDSDWTDLLATNLTGTFLVAQCVSRGMVARRQGKIINIGSVQSKLARPGTAAYGTTKGGIAMLTRGLCADLAPYNIQVNALAPGYFVTDITRPLFEDPEFSEWVTNRTPARRWGEVEELIGGLIYLASPASQFVNGQVIYIDGGMTAVI